MDISKLKTYREFKRESLKEPKVLAEYLKLQPAHNIAVAILRQRLERKMTQAVLAKKIGTKQTAIARLESGSYNPTIKQLEKIAEALDLRLVIKMVK